MTIPVSAEPAEHAATWHRLWRGGVPAPSAWWVLIAGVIGLVASMTLTVEKIEILLNPSYVPSCNINPIVSCGSVMVTPQASVLGFPNPLLGIVASPWWWSPVCWQWRKCRCPNGIGSA